MLLARVTRSELEAYRERDNRILFPIGSTEQHGPRGVFGTDGLIAQGLAEALGERCGVLTAPLMPYGMSEHHLGFPGSVSLRPESLIAVVSDILRSFWLAGFHRIVIVNGHGGNSSPLSCAVVSAAEACTGIQVKLLEWFKLEGAKAFLDKAFGESEGLHGTPGELSLILAMFDDLIARDRQPMQARLNLDVCLTRKLLEERYLDGTINADQNLASKSFGEELFRICVENMIGEVQEWQLRAEG
jgi:creatinine amidohydrolase